MKEIKTITTTGIQQLITEGLQELIAQGYIVTSGFTTNSVPWFYLTKGEESVQYGANCSGRGITIEKNVRKTNESERIKEVLQEFFPIEWSGRNEIFVASAEELAAIKELRSARRVAKSTESKVFEGKQAARSVRKVPGFKTVPSYLVKIERVRAGYKVTNTRTSKSTVIGFVK